ncbi:CinA family nicotinamide mononucleotide deamidase-related protein [Halanaerobium hydrogeniformans]|uniref:Putative competence-damage inducible protein n=1 Tax=Halanaerobium hydrogeniformans TaxID=656519 RepID=E4RKJ8_HALHG|nr:CinA family nicotinamide mononucleotide deamidase-related protein [Halanaerobium hydrogeniformans]ADQ14707.1 competence/damage-inducible protein CinA [Halanaerobium hydrogeniformans]
MNTAIIATGSELLAGLVKDSNSKFLAENLRELGFTVTGIYLSSDKKEDIIRTIKFASENAELIFITGGLGPTEDDLSRDALAEALDRELIYSEEIARSLKDFFARHDYKMTENNFRQAYLPKDAKIIKNNNGTAPALKIFDNQTRFYLLPGVPREMVAIFNNSIKKELEKLSKNKIIYREYNFIGIGESTLEDKFNQIKIDSQIEKSYQATKGEVKLRLKVLLSDSMDREKTETMLDNAEQKLVKHLGEYLYSKDDKDILEIFVEKIKNSRLTIASAESFTGGLFAKRLSDKAGSSQFFKGSIVAYTKEAKINLLNLDPQIIKKYGMISKECVTAMAKNTAEIFKSDIAIAFSGVAGPGSMEDKMPGTMHIAIKYNDEIKTIELNKNYGRSLNRYYATQIAFFETIKLLK